MKHLSVFLLFSMCLLLFASSCEQNIERYCFTASNRSPKINERITFNAQCSEGVDLYHWNFGDGRDTVTKKNTIEYSFEQPGEYQVTLHSTHMQIQNDCPPNPSANSGARQTIIVAP